MERLGPPTSRPPPMDLDDPGLRWDLTSGTLRIERRTNARSLVLPVLLLGGAVTMFVVTLRDDDLFVTSVFGLVVLALLGFLAARALQRTELRLDDDALAWQQVRPRPFHGSLPRSRIDSVRIHRGPKPTRWFARRRLAVELRLDGAWMPVAAGHAPRRAEALAEALALRLGSVVQTEDEPR